MNYKRIQINNDRNILKKTNCIYFEMTVCSKTETDSQV